MSQPENNMKANSLSNSAEEHILVADVNRIKEYLFASVRLRHIINASAMLAYVNETLTEELVKKKGGEIIFTAGGGTQAFFSDKCKAKECAEELEEIYPEHTGTATVAVHVKEVGEDFVTAIREATQTIRLKKDAAVSPEGDERLSLQPEFEPIPFFNGSPFFRICEQTGKAYAAFWERPREPDEVERKEDINPEAFSASAWKQKKWAKDFEVELQRHLNEHPDGKQMGLNIKLGDRLAVDVRLRHQLACDLNLSPDDFEYPFDFNKLVAPASPGNYLGLMDADGNGFGDLLVKLAEGKGEKKPDKGDYKALSELLSETTREAFIKAAAEVLKPFLLSQAKRLAQQKEKKQKRERIRIPLRVLIMGGDDLFVVALPQHILAIANEFCRQFQFIAEENKSEGDLLKQLPPLTMSAGVVIAHYNFPFLSFQRLANRLLKNAKKRAWEVKREWQAWKEQGGKGEEPQKPTGSVDFQIITASGAEDLKTIRKESYTRKDPHGENISLTGRPYLVGCDLDELRDLRHFIGKLKASEISRRQIKGLNQILRQNFTQSHFDFLYWFSRLREDQKKVIKDFPDLQTICLSPWRCDNRPGGSGNIYTPLLDVVELFDIRDELADEEINQKKEGGAS